MEVISLFILAQIAYILLAQSYITLLQLLLRHFKAT